MKSITAAGVVWGDYQAKKPDVFRKTIMDCLRYAAEEKITPHFSASYPLDKVSKLTSLYFGTYYIEKELF